MPVKAIGADLVTKAFENIRLDLPNLQQRLLTEISSSTISLLRANTPKETGELANSWYEISKTIDTVTIGVKDGQSDKLKYIIFGTRPHTIYPKTANSLHWINPDTGRDVYAKKVNHPGTRPFNFIASVLYTISLNIDSVMRKLMKQSHPYYSNIGVGTFYGFNNLSIPKGKGIKTPSNIVGLTGLKYVRRRGRGRSYISRVSLNAPKLTRRIAVGRRRT